MNLYHLVATCSKGTEPLVANELKDLGATEIEQTRGAVSWKGTLATAYRTCLWSRFCSRILLEVATFPISDDLGLYPAGAEARARNPQAELLGARVVWAGLVAAEYA